MLQPGAPEVDADGTAGTGARLRGTVTEIKDLIAAWMAAPRSRSRARVEPAARAWGMAGFVGLGVARIKGREADGSVTLDPDTSRHP